MKKYKLITKTYDSPEFVSIIEVHDTGKRFAELYANILDNLEEKFYILSLEEIQQTNTNMNI